MADTSYVEKVYKKQEGDELVIADHGQITVESGGEIEIETGGALVFESGSSIDIQSGTTFDIQTGAELTVENGGTIDVESGGSLDIENGAELTVESGGTIDVESGGTIDIESGGHIDLESGGVVHLEAAGSLLRFFTAEDYTATQLAALFRSMGRQEITNYSTGATVLSDMGGSSPPVIPSTIGLLMISASGGMTNGSLRLFSGIAGQTLRIEYINDMNGSTCSLTIYASILGLTGVKLIGSHNTELSSVRMTNSLTSAAAIDLICIKDGTWAIRATRSALVTEQLSA